MTTDKKTETPKPQAKSPVPDARAEETTTKRNTELTDEELAEASAGCCNGSHYK
jgi:hypothetical protein